MYCPNCKKDVGDDALFCPECGTRTGPVSQKRCSACGMVLDPDMAFCPECGQPISDTPHTVPLQKETPWHENQGYDPQGYPQHDLSYGQPGEYPQRPGPIPDHNYPGSTPPAPSQKKALIGIIAAACTCVLIVCAAAIVFVLNADKNDSNTVSKEEQTSQDQKKEEDKTSISSNDKKEKKEEEKKTDQVVQVLGDDTAEENDTAEEKTEKKSVQTETPTQPKTFTGAKDKTSQQDAVTAGGQLDLQHMGNLLGNTGATYGSYVLDITNMQEYDAGSADTPLPASALIGVPILFTIADGVDKGEIDLDTPVTLVYTFANGRGVFKSGDNGRTFPVSQMLSEALMNSDNNALNSLIDFLSLDRINTTCHSYGFSSVDMQRKLMTGTTSLENYLSAKDAALMLNAIYQDNFTGIGRAFLQTNFKISGSDTANRGMYPACNSCAMFLNLNGITESRYNEIGLIQNGDEVFILSVFTCNGVGTTSASALTTLSSYVVSTLHAQ